MRRTALTLIELMVVIAILAVLAGMLLTAIRKVHSASIRMRDMNNLKQIGLATINYSTESGYLPPAKTRVNGNDRWWFAETTPGGQIVDFRQGHLMPYLEYNYMALQVPAKAPGPVYLRYDGMSGGYGYNYRYLAPFEEMPDGSLHWTRILPAKVLSASRTIAFCNAVDITTEPLPTGSPSLIETPLSEPPSAQAPGVHFRQHGQIANVLFVDGHVESIAEGTQNPVPGESAAIRELREKHHVYDLGETDELWDLK